MHTQLEQWAADAAAPGEQLGFGALLKSLTSVVDYSCWSRDSNPQPRVTSPTLYPLGHDCPTRPWLYPLGHDYEGFFTSTVNWSKLKSKTVKRKGSINCRTDLAHYALISLSFVLWTSLCGLQSAAPARCDSVLLHKCLMQLCIGAFRIIFLFNERLLIAFLVRFICYMVLPRGGRYDQNLISRYDKFYITITIYITI